MPRNDPRLNPSLAIAALQRLQRVVEEISDVAAVRRAVTKELVLAQTIDDPREAPIGGFRTRGRTFFDELQLEILASIRAARSREDLVKLVIERLAVGSSEERAALCYIIFEGRAPDGRLEIEPILQAGLRLERFDAFVRDAKGLQNSPILERLFIERQTVDFSYTEYLRGTGYDGEFDALFDSHKRGVWIAGVPLPGIDASMPDRALIGLYPSTGPADLPNLPRGARPEWRLMEFLQTGYALLNHQLEGRAEIVAADRRNLIADLAPQAINHELATQLGALEDQLRNILDASRLLNDSLKDEPVQLKQIASALTGGFNAIHRAKRITDAFNNLERRSAGVAIRVRDLIDEVNAIIDYRRKKLGIAISIDGNGLDIELRTDAALVEHLLLNVLINAIDEFEEGKSRPPLIAISATRNAERLRFIISNNGPPIDVTRRDSIFEKGVTTKKRGQGHGQGLYICRLVANYILGSIELLREAPEGMNVGFAIEVPIVARHREDLMGQRARSRR